jgi:hypothetical protein
MFGLLRVRGFVAVLTMFAALFATPSTAIAAESLSTELRLFWAPGEAEPEMLPAAETRSLADLVGAFVDRADQDAEQLCLAKAVYFEARGESLEGQLAVAEVILNRAASGRYPATICRVVTQPAQFSFIRRGRFPRVDTASDCWRKALAIADVARNQLADQVGPNVLWYHATYVSPSWGRRLTRVARIGTHIFYS